MSTASPQPAFQVLAELKVLDQWVLWRQEMRRGVPTKVLYQLDGSLAKTNDRGTWASYTKVQATFRPDLFACRTAREMAPEGGGRWRHVRNDDACAIPSFTREHLPSSDAETGPIFRRDYRLPCWPILRYL
jgi:hypothetical protein